MLSNAVETSIEKYACDRTLQFGSNMESVYLLG
jgi:hypothetical protein